MNVPAHETVGHELPLWETAVDRVRQDRFHEAAGVSGTAFGETVDVSVLSNDCLHGARPREALGAKRLHVGVRVKQHAAIPLGEPLGVLARVDNIRPDVEADIFTSAFNFAGRTGRFRSRSTIKV